MWFFLGGQHKKNWWSLQRVIRAMQSTWIWVRKRSKKEWQKQPLERYERMGFVFVYFFFNVRLLNSPQEDGIFVTPKWEAWVRWVSRQDKRSTVWVNGRMELFCSVLEANVTSKMLVNCTLLQPPTTQNCGGCYPGQEKIENTRRQTFVVFLIACRPMDYIKQDCKYQRQVLTVKQNSVVNIFLNI